MPSFLHISFDFSGPPKIKELKPVFDKALDWYRYTSNCWIVWSTNDAERWYARLKPLLDDGDTMLIIPFEFSPMTGFASQDSWDFFAKHHE
jgi:hypothetical protein